MGVKEFVMRCDPRVQYVEPLFGVLAGVLISIASAFFLLEGKILVGIAMAGMALLLFTMSIFRAKSVKPDRKIEGVIDDVSIKIVVDGIVEKSVFFTDIAVVGAYWNSHSQEPIMGFWIRDKSRGFIGFSFWDGWKKDDLRRALEIILSRREEYNFRVDKYLQKHLDRYGGVYRHPGRAR
jgi:hypothetical protein